MNGKREIFKCEIKNSTNYSILKKEKGYHIRLVFLKKGKKDNRT